MSNQFHRDLSGLELHVPGYNQGTDPGSVGAGMYWYDSANAVLKIRNLSNGGWDTVHGAYVTSVDPGAIGAGGMWIDSAFGIGGYVLKIRNSGNTGWETLSGGQTPIGCPIPFDKTLMASVGVTTLPWGWVECNGQVLSDVQSILNGQTIPNMNTGSGTGRFVRGTTGATGVTQTNQNASHTHTISVTDPGHAHSVGSLVNSSVGDHTHSAAMGGGGSTFPGASGSGGSSFTTGGAGAHNHTISGSVAPSTTSVSASASSQGGSEARPDSMTMCWIMRTK
jgi:hypothetical protein